jgi:murein DD-endopeptidase MepM/ murein hydrolase activator NlpD
MTRKGPRSGRVIPALAACFVVGMLAGWSLRSGAPVPATSEIDRRQAPVPSGPSDTPSPARTRAAVAPGAVATTGEPLIGPDVSGGGVLADLRRHDLLLPIEGANVDAMKGGFAQGRDQGRRAHEAVDILAPRHTPIHAVDDGTIAKLFRSQAGGITVYQFDPSGRYCYYYAHLERYAPGLSENQAVERGEVLGFVGTSGNAPPNTPHLHFAVFELDAHRQWWKGRPVDPYLIFKE